MQQQYWRLQILIPQLYYSTVHHTRTPLSVLLISSIALLIAPVVHVTQLDQPHKASDAVTLRNWYLRKPDAT